MEENCSPAAPARKPFFSEEEEQAMDRVFNTYKPRLASLPKEKGWVTDHMYKYQGFWYKSQFLTCVEGVMAVQDHFRAHPADVLLATHPKCGTLWLKALGFAIVTRSKHKDFAHHHPLLTTNPHALVPLIELSVYKTMARNGFLEPPDTPRVLATHIPYTSLPGSFVTSGGGCRIVYMCRNPRDALVSRWFYDNKVRDPLRPPVTLEDAFDKFTRGVSSYGPFWDHVVVYHRVGLERPDHVLFLTYEDMKRDPRSNVKRMAAFLGCPFTEEEEEGGAVEEIIRLCSFESLSGLEVNRNGVVGRDVKNDIFFRKGVVGDSENYLTPEMIETIDRITREKFRGTNITL